MLFPGAIAKNNMNSKVYEVCYRCDKWNAILWNISGRKISHG